MTFDRIVAIATFVVNIICMVIALLSYLKR